MGRISEQLFEELVRAILGAWRLDEGFDFARLEFEPLDGRIS